MVQICSFSLFFVFCFFFIFFIFSFHLPFQIPNPQFQNYIINTKRDERPTDLTNFVEQGGIGRPLCPFCRRPCAASDHPEDDRCADRPSKGKRALLSSGRLFICGDVGRGGGPPPGGGGAAAPPRGASSSAADRRAERNEQRRGPPPPPRAPLVVYVLFTFLPVKLSCPGVFRVSSSSFGATALIVRTLAAGGVAYHAPTSPRCRDVSPVEG